MKRVKCEACGGTGFVHGSCCRKCEGSMSVEAEKWFVTPFCNFAHRLSDGKPINHECYILNPRALEAERDGDYEKARELLSGKRFSHRGLKR